MGGIGFVLWVLMVAGVLVYAVWPLLSVAASEMNTSREGDPL